MSQNCSHYRDLGRDGFVTRTIHCTSGVSSSHAAFWYINKQNQIPGMCNLVVPFLQRPSTDLGAIILLSGAEELWMICFINRSVETLTKPDILALHFSDSQPPLQTSANLSSNKKPHNEGREMTPSDKPQLPEAAQTPKSFNQAAEQDL